ncbi:hypothetical protein HPB51_021479 [Rhipicephalus microplus]|uniref:Rhabdovirus nucleocapsid domain-containing protein n=1 Tax=Rhipicephalus microplus TaxID=6941 RepID=A0A9J6DIY2_RHIMP|nr:uncharacterized protein LOC119174287 [Rhipicephalus microplus]KAH8022039.1 hypothetical protein HPB51_021479 [Rhipicephalus microplus]
MAPSDRRKEDWALPADVWNCSRALGEPTARPPPEYPSEWFAAHPGSKPIALVKRCFASDERLAEAVSAGLAAGSLQVEYVVEFMYVEGAKIKGTLMEDWKSFGVTIGCAGEVVSPWDLLTITEQMGSEYPVDTETTAVDNAPNRAGLLALVVCIYRLLVAKCHGGRQNYIQRLRDNNLKCILETFRCSSTYLERAEHKFGHWIKDRSYLSMIAALDMFFNRFSRHDKAVLRAGTHVSRYKHCAVLDDIRRLCKVTHLTPSELFRWVFLERIVGEIGVTGARGQELFEEHSYAPYLSDLGLSRRSPYSATANPLLHYWCNAVASLMGVKQAQKSRITHECDLSDATINAVVFAYAHLKCYWRCTFVPLALKTVDEADAPRDIGQMPKAFNAEQWYQYLSEKSFVVDPKILNYSLFERFADVRDGTVGAKLAELIPK